MKKCMWAVVLCLAATPSSAQPPQRGEGPIGPAGPRGAQVPIGVAGETVPGQPGAAQGGVTGPAGNRGALPGQPIGSQFAQAANPMFAAIDANGDGMINAQELRRAVVALRTLDVDGDGNITLAEASPQFAPGNPAQMIDQSFAQYDKNGDGLLTADELPEAMARMLARWDGNGDGAVSRDELAASMPNMGNMAGGPGGRGLFDPQQMSQRTLQQYDRNGDGRLTVDEVPPQIANMLQGADRNGDGAIDMQELQGMAGSMGQRMGRGLGPGGELGPGMERGPRRGGRGGDQ